MKKLKRTFCILSSCILLLSSCNAIKYKKIANTKMANKSNKVLLVGIDPKELDFTKITNLTESELSSALKNELNKLNAEGYQAKWCLVDLGETAENVLRTELKKNQYDLVLVGAGIRTLPNNFQLFENLINVIHQYAPNSKIAFNTNPNDTEIAVKRWTNL